MVGFGSTIAKLRGWSATYRLVDFDRAGEQGLARIVFQNCLFTRIAQVAAGAETACAESGISERFVREIMDERGERCIIDADRAGFQLSRNLAPFLDGPGNTAADRP